MASPDIPSSDLPRERLLRLGTAPLQDAELLALVLGTGASGVGVMSAASALRGRFVDLRRLAAAGVAEIAAVRGIGLAKACRVKAALALAGRLADRPFMRGDPFGGPREVFDRVGRRLLGAEREQFIVLALDAKNRILTQTCISEGGSCSVDILPRDVFATLVREAAAGSIFIHNHPSGDPNPSPADRRLTDRLKSAAELIGVGFVDHVIVGQSGYYSFCSGTAENADP